ncbi:glutaminase [Bradyrhizobium sp. USDA 4472]
MGPDHATIADAVQEAHAVALRASGGAVAAYIPFLAKVPAQLCAVAVVTREGRVFEAGDTDFQFALESISKVFTLALVMEQRGAEVVREKIGARPTGLPFNSVLALELHGAKPLSPLVNAGAIATVSLVKAAGREDRWAQILDVQRRFAATDIAFSAEINESEQASNLHNRAIAWLLASGGNCFCDPLEALDVYTRQCSTLVTCSTLATMAATLANHGINPLTGIRVIQRQNVPRILAEMTMEGLYDSSGDWAFEVGLPGKSGVGGGIIAVAPGRLGVAAFAPSLDEYGNSVRGQIAVASVAKRLKMNLYDQ